MASIDHVLLATTELDHGERQLWHAYGLRCLPGGSHLSWGTANRVVPIGRQYLELVAVENRELAAGSLLGRAVLAAAERDRLCPIGLCLAVEHLEAVAARLGTAVEEGTRTLADGTEIGWQSVGLEQAFGQVRLPFFIRWRDPGQHPSRGRAEHRVAAQEISLVEVGGPEATLRRHLGGEVPGVLAVGGAPGIHSLAISDLGGGQTQLP
ncbi:MAG: VOC family protein [Candidatus Dormibacteria bacterium]